MHIPAWQITTWSDVTVSLVDWNPSVAKLRHLGTSSYEAESGEGSVRCGQALWGLDGGRGERLGIAWDWREARPGVVVMADPMMILSNLVFLDDDGKRVDRFKRILHLNNAIFALPWQRFAGRERSDEALAA